VVVPSPAVLAATLPVVLLAILVLRRQPLTRSAWIAAGFGAVLAVTVFGLSAVEVGVAVVRGAWTAVWILLIVLPALLLFEVLDRSGALDHLAAAADHIAPTEGRRLLLLAWILPSFLQGAAGFGAPIAMSAPMLVRRGMAPVAAVAACLIGYQWSVTFGSMGSSYFMAEATARLSAGEAGSFALRAGIILAFNAVLSGLLVLTRGRRSPGDLWRTLALGTVMGVVLVAVVSAQPALGSTAAGLAGLVAAWWLLPRRGTRRPAGTDAMVAALPYAVLTVAAAIGFGVPPVRALFDRVPELAPVLPGATAAFGFATPDAAVTPAFRPLLHPLPYVLLAVVVAVLAYRRRGWWAPGSTAVAVRTWRRRSTGVATSIAGLTILAAVLTESGMVTAIAEALARGLGGAFVLVSAPIGALGTMLTGSTTASNALFSSLQAEVAVALSIAPAVLLSGQTAGGNIGNAISPAVTAVGTAAAGATRREGEVLRRNLGASLLLLLSVVVALVVQVWVLA
jgi:lactate permease